MENRTMRKILMLTCSLLLCNMAFSTPVTDAAGQFKGTYILPVVMDLSGPDASNTAAVVQTMRDYAMYQNEERGGVGGYELQLKYIDDKYNQSIMLTVYKQLAAEGHQAISYFSSASGSALKSLANRDKVVIICWANTDGAYLDKGEKDLYVFDVSPPYADIYATFVTFAYNKLWPKMNINRKPVFGGFNMDVSTGRQASKGIQLQCEELGLKYVPTFAKIGTQETTSQITTLKENAADFVAGIQLGNDTVVFFKDCKRLDFRPIFGFHAAHEKHVIETGVSIGSWNYYLTGGVDSEGHKVMQKYWDRHSKGKPMGNISKAGWMYNVPLITAIDRVLKKVGSKENLTGTLVKEEMEKIRMEDLTMGLVNLYNYTPTNHTGPTGVKWGKLLDEAGRMEWSDWIAFPKRPQEQLTAEFWRK